MAELLIGLLATGVIYKFFFAKDSTPKTVEGSVKIKKWYYIPPEHSVGLGSINGPPLKLAEIHEGKYGMPTYVMTDALGNKTAIRNLPYM